METALLKPLIVLAAWTMVMWAWMCATRLPAMTAAKLDPESLVKDGKKNLDDLLPPHVQWKAHNYNHLHEAPTIFYAVVLALAVMGASDSLNTALAWAYVGLRIVHSLVQATVNRVVLRFWIFVFSSLVLIVLVARAAMVAFST